MWRRAHGFFDVVTYEGDGQAVQEVPHSLGVAPEMLWVKCRDVAKTWSVYHHESDVDPRANYLALQENWSAASDDTYRHWADDFTE